MSITIVEGVTKRAADIPDGTVFTGRIGTYSERLFMKIYGGGITALDGNAPGTGSGLWQGCPSIADYREVNIEIRIIL